MNKRGNIIYLFLLIIVATVATGALYFYYKQKSFGTISPTTEVPQTPTPALSESLNWKTYRNDEYGFEIKHPETWQQRGPVTINDPILVYIHSDSNLEEANPYIYISIAETLPKTGLEEIRVTDKTAFVSDKTPSRLGSLTYYFKNQRGNLSISYTPYDKEKPYPEQEKYLETFSQILSTLRFIDEGSTEISPTPTPPAGWKLQEFTGLNVKLFAPNDWETKLDSFPDDSSSLISMRKNIWDYYPVTLDVRKNWDNTGNAKDEPANYTITEDIEAYREDPPKKEELTLERYQTNVYFEHEDIVYIFPASTIGKKTRLKPATTFSSI
jgi:hypothetical protein